MRSLHRHGTHPHGCAQGARRTGAADPHPGRHRRAVRPRDQCARLVLRRGARLDVRGLQRGPGRALSSCRSRAAKSIFATPSPRRMRAPIPPPSPQPREREGDSYFITGEKWHVTSYNLASHMVVQAKLADGRHHGRALPVLLSRRCARRRHRALARLRPHLRPPSSDPPLRQCRGSGCATASARRATAWASPMPGSGASG